MPPLTVWFYGKDIMIDIVSSLIILFILFYAIRYSRINRKQVKYRYFIISFSILFMSFIFKILSHLIIYYSTTKTRHIGLITIVYQSLKQSSFLIFWGTLVYRILSLLAFYVLYLIYSEKRKFREIWLIIYLLLAIGYLSNSAYYIYLMTSLFLLSMIIFSIYKTYTQNRYHNTRNLMYGFIIIAISQLSYIFIFLEDDFYILGEILQLIGYLTLFYTFVKVVTGVKKKRKN